MRSRSPFVAQLLLGEGALALAGVPFVAQLLLGDGALVLGEHALVLGDGAGLALLGQLLREAHPLLAGGRQELLAVAVPGEPQHRTIRRRRDHPPQAEADALAQVVALRRPLQQLPVHAIPGSQRLLPVRRIEAHHLGDAARLVALELAGPVRVATIRRAHDLDRQIRGAALPDLPRVERLLAGAELHEHVRREALLWVARVPVHELLRPDRDARERVLQQQIQRRAGLQVPLRLGHFLLRGEFDRPRSPHVEPAFAEERRVLGNVDHGIPIARPRPRWSPRAPARRARRRPRAPHRRDGGRVGSSRRACPRPPADQINSSRRRPPPHTCWCWPGSWCRDRSP